MAFATKGIRMRNASLDKIQIAMPNQRLKIPRGMLKGHVTLPDMVASCQVNAFNANVERLTVPHAEPYSVGPTPIEQHPVTSRFCNL